MAYKSYFDFKLGNKKLSDFGGKLHNGSNDYVKINLLPSMTKEVEEIPLVDGNIYYGGRYDPREINLDIIIENSNLDEEGFTNWIKSKTAQWFNFIGDDKKILVVYDDIVDMQIYNYHQSMVTLKFIAHDPYWYLIDDVVFTKISPAINTTYTIANRGNVESYPLIKINCTTTQTITFELNGKQYKLNGVINDTYIDCYTCTVYTINGNSKTNRIALYQCLNGKYKYEFGSLNFGDNSIKIIGGTVNSLIINCKSRFI